MIRLRRLVRPGEAITVLRLRKPQTLASYVAAGKLSEIRLPGGGRRYVYDEVTALADERPPMIVSAGATGEVALDGAQERPAAGAAQASMPAGRQEDAAPGLGTGGFPRPGAAFPPNPLSREGGRQ